jgi:uncharacterized protein (DUF2267 family)
MAEIRKDPTHEETALDRDIAARSDALAFDEIYHNFLADLGHKAGYDPTYAERVSSSVLCLLDQQLRAGQTAAPYAHLPTILIRLLTACSRPGESAGLGFSPEDLIASVAVDLDLDEEDAAEVVRQVFAATRRAMGEKGARSFGRKLPSAIQRLWFGAH